MIPLLSGFMKLLKMPLTNETILQILHNMALTDNFTLLELMDTRVPDGVRDNLSSINLEQFGNLMELSAFLQYVRSAFQVPIKINSAFRSKMVNEHVGGVPTSNHLKGLAADIAYTWPSATHDAILDFFHKCLVSGVLTEVITYKTFVHIAIHPDHVQDKKYYPLPF